MKFEQYGGGDFPSLAELESKSGDMLEEKVDEYFSKVLEGAGVSVRQEIIYKNPRALDLNLLNFLFGAWMKMASSANQAVVLNILLEIGGRICADEASYNLFRLLDLREAFIEVKDYMIASSERYEMRSRKRLLHRLHKEIGIELDKIRREEESK